MENCKCLQRQLSVCVLLTSINHNIFPMFLQTWRDNKTKASEKAAKLRAGRAQMGNKLVGIHLSELDKKIWASSGTTLPKGCSNHSIAFRKSR